MYCSNCGHKLEQGAQFCGNCGKAIAPLSYTIAPSPAPKKKSFKPFVIVFCLVIIGILSYFVINDSKSHYSFDGNYSEPIVEPKEEEQEEEGPFVSEQFVKTEGESIKKDSSGTAIIYDNTYTGVVVTDKELAYSLIKEDSVLQKVNCPNEIKKIEDMIINNYGIKAVNLCEMDLDFANELANVFKNIYQEYPEAKGYLTNVTLYNENDKSKENVIAAFGPFFLFESSTESYVFKMQIILNAAYFLNPTRLESSASVNSEMGWFPKNSTKYSPVAHEFGHYLSFIAMLKHYNGDSVLIIDESTEYLLYDLARDFKVGEFSYKMIEEAYENYKKDHPTNLSLDEWRSQISTYAMAKDDSGNYIYDETIAEAFHDVYLNKNNAALPSIYIVEVLKSRLKG